MTFRRPFFLRRRRQQRRYNTNNNNNNNSGDGDQEEESITIPQHLVGTTTTLTMDASGVTASPIMDSSFPRDDDDDDDNNSNSNNNNNNNNSFPNTGSLPASDNSSSLNNSFFSRWTTTSSAACSLPDGGGLNTSILGSSELPFLSHHETTGGIPAHPRRMWKVSDTRIPVYPSHLWPLPPSSTSTRIDNTTISPSVLAVRIAECLRKRSIAADYDDEAAIAYCQTIDRCHFKVHLWRQHHSSDSEECFLLVECVRASGNSLSFHQHARAILLAAESLDSGADRRSVYQSSHLEYPRLLAATAPTTVQQQSPPQQEQQQQTLNGNLPIPCQPWPLITAACAKGRGGQSSLAAAAVAAASAVESLEQAFALLCKDRWEAQIHGMQMVVLLTDAHSSGMKVAETASKPIAGSDFYSNFLLERLHQDWIARLIVDRHLPFEEQQQDEELLGDDSESNHSGSSSYHRHVVTTSNALEDRHAGQMRALALRAYTNALINLSPTVDATPDILDALQEDLLGASRPADVVCRLATPHEAALAAKCLELLAQHPMIRDMPELPNLLDKAAAVGRSTHLVLAVEARTAFQQVTAEDREC